MNKSNLKFLALSILSLINIAAGIYLTLHFYDIREGTAAFHSLCNLNAAVNCDQVAGSNHAELIAGLPLSSFVVAWYLAILSFTLLALKASWKQQALCLLALMTGTASFFSIYYTLVMIATLKSLCVFCLLISVLDFTALGLVLSFRPSLRLQSLRKLFTTQRLITVTMIVVFYLASVPLALKASFSPSRKQEQSRIEQIANGVLSSPALEIHTEDALQTIGPKDAPITIVEFSDFECPFCKGAAVVMNSLMNRFPGKIRLIFKNYPLDNNCNATMDGPMHPMACEAARAAHCATQQGKFKEIYESIFEHQDELAPGSPAKLALSLGIESQKFLACLSDPATAQLIAADIDAATKLGIQQSAPTFFVNGRRLDGAYPIAVWEKIVRALLP